MNYAMLSFEEMDAEVSKGALRALANEVCSGLECINQQLIVKKQSFFQSISAQYAHDPWFMDLNEGGCSKICVSIIKQNGSFYGNCHNFDHQGDGKIV